jgi:hypothetical protein
MNTNTTTHVWDHLTLKRRQRVWPLLQRAAKLQNLYGANSMSRIARFQVSLIRRLEAVTVKSC